MLYIVVPMAGRGVRFAEAGYDLPKPLIDVVGRPMISWVVDSLKPGLEALSLVEGIDYRFVFVVLSEHIESFGIDYIIKSLYADSIIIALDNVTKGCLCTVLGACEFLDNSGLTQMSDSLLVANSDQYFVGGLDTLLSCKEDGGVLSFRSDDPACSYVCLDESGYISYVAEKVVVSDRANVGVYFFRSLDNFVNYGKEYVSSGSMLNGEFYLAPMMNLMVDAGNRLVSVDVEEFWGLGTPERFNAFVERFK